MTLTVPKLRLNFCTALIWKFVPLVVLKAVKDGQSTAMVDKIKRAFDDLDAPICPTCHIEMKWTQSTLVVADTIRHIFHCPSCHRTGETTSKIKAVVVPPDKLSAPAFRRAA